MRPHAGTIGSLLLGVYLEADRLRFAGHVGTGFTDHALRLLQQEAAPLARATPPVPDVPRETPDPSLPSDFTGGYVGYFGYETRVNGWTVQRDVRRR